MKKDKKILEVKNLVVRFNTQDGPIHAVNGVSYTLNEEETLGIVGESGSGKSVHVLAMLGLIPQPPGKIEGGEVWFEGRDLLKLPPRELRQIRGNKIAMVFQDPMTSLNPVLTIGRQITEVLTQHLGMSATQAKRRAAELLDLVGIANARDRLNTYPHQFSGGMRQRATIAMALAANPKILIADEPTTALDVTIQAQIVELVKQLKQQLGMATIWITHDLGVVAGIADTLNVMYAGRLLERGPVRSIFRDARNAYTVGLLESLPRLDSQRRDRLQQIDGAPPDLRIVPKGDPFAPRNRWATARCFEEMPALRPVADGHPDHWVAAWYDLRSSRGGDRGLQ
ncbi:MAG: ABC transporter ATP-binding protein [Cyanobacteriota bacterium]|nr:ABC transporter ATP-binding protein [Cyanobacteriota bacterium]